MSSVAKRKKVSREEFLAYFDSIDHKAEWLDGEIWDLAGGLPAHSLIGANITRELGNALKDSDCYAYNSDLIIQIEADASIVLPDATVVCGELVTAWDRKDFVKNPTLVVEERSKDRGNYDLEGKFLKYMTIPSLREYVVIDQYEVRVDVFYRTDSGLWDIKKYAEPSSSITFQSIFITIPLAEIYRGVTFA
jgi:Uma2 family endonuclease